MEKIIKGFIGLFGGLTGTVFGKEIIVFIISLMPILELRGGLLAASLLGLDPLPSYTMVYGTNPKMDENKKKIKKDL